GHSPRQSLSTEVSEGRGRYLRITIENGDDRPLTVQRVTAESIDRWLVLEQAKLTGATGSIAVYAGDPRRIAPQYDLARIIGDVDPADFAGVGQIGVREAN